MKTIYLIVDNRTFLLGLDDLYRDRMQPCESNELLQCAREVASTLDVAKADVPVEGYYHESEELTEYFLLMRALQRVDSVHRSKVGHLDSYQRLYNVATSPMFGKGGGGPVLFPSGQDVLSLALSQKTTWTIPTLTQAAYELALDSDDCSLVALAAIARDAVVLTALRETAVLYANMLDGLTSSREELEFIYEWNVDPVLEKRANAFIDCFNQLIDNPLPPARAENVKTFWLACDETAVKGRCVRIARNPLEDEKPNYHWAIDSQNGELTAVEFWDAEIWTTKRFREKIGS